MSDAMQLTILFGGTALITLASIAIALIGDWLYARKKRELKNNTY